jgi:hypothetical protein
VSVEPRAGNPDTWAEKDGRSPTIALTELATNPMEHFEMDRSIGIRTCYDAHSEGTAECEPAGFMTALFPETPVRDVA